MAGGVCRYEPSYLAKQSAPSEGEVEEVEEVIDDEQLN